MLSIFLIAAAVALVSAAPVLDKRLPLNDVLTDAGCEGFRLTSPTQIGLAFVEYSSQQVSWDPANSSVAIIDKVDLMSATGDVVSTFAQGPFPVTNLWTNYHPLHLQYNPTGNYYYKLWATTNDGKQCIYDSVQIQIIAQETIQSSDSVPSSPVATAESTSSIESVSFIAPSSSINVVYLPSTSEPATTFSSVVSSSISPVPTFTSRSPKFDLGLEDFSSSVPLSLIPASINEFEAFSSALWESMPELESTSLASDFLSDVTPSATSDILSSDSFSGVIPSATPEVLSSDSFSDIISSATSEALSSDSFSVIPSETSDILASIFTYISSVPTTTPSI